MNAPFTGARYIGQRVPRKEDARLLTGRGQFVDDITLPGMCHTAFARSPIARGKIISIDTSAALDVPGVHAVYTAEDLRQFDVKFLTFYFTESEVPIHPLADGYVMYVGDPVALVVADNRYIAEDAAALIEVEYEEEDPVVTISQAMSAPPIHPGAEDNVAAQMGDDELEDEFAALLENAPHLIEHKVVHARVSQSPMETRGVVSSRDGTDQLTLYIGCQSPHLVSRWVTTALNLPTGSVRVIAKDVGGAFGLKNHPWREEVAVILASFLFGRPLKWIEDRLENLTAANQAREQEMTLKIAADKAGNIIASQGDYNCNNGAYTHVPDCNIAVHMFMWSAYKEIPYAFFTRGWFTNTVGLAAYRGPWAMESLIRETGMDRLARQIGMEPVEFRRQNLLKKEDQPSTTALGIIREDITPAECLEKLLENFDLAAFRKEQSEAREQGRYIGLGTATYIEPTGTAGAIPSMTGELAQIRIDPTGKVIATMSTHSQGHGTATTMAQVIADRLGVPYEDVTVYEGDSQHGGFGAGAAGSRQGVIGGGAAILASEKLAEKVKTLAAHLLNANAEAITIEDGMVHVDGAPEMSRSVKAIAEIAYGEPDMLPPGFEAGLEIQHRYQPPPVTFTSAASACIVEVDPDTGFVKILRWISSEDCGTVINPAVVEGQIAGGLAQAIGMVLLEEIHHDARGNPTAVTYKDYLLPSITDVPDFEYLHAKTPSQSVGGIRGVGEGGAIIGPPTLVNAIADALTPFGEIEVSLPLTPTKTLSVIEGRDLSAKKAEKPAPAAPEVKAHESDASVSEAPISSAPEQPAAIQSEVTSIDGEWKVVLSTPMGPQEMIAEFVTDGSAVSGELKSNMGNMGFSGGVLEGNNLKFDLKAEKPMKMTLKYSIDFEGDTLTGTCKLGMMGKAKLKGERV